ncbi:MAG TPA: hypothetical protein VF629_06095 [Hymenobacter sp.]|jgi:hypothetical protein|uniref:hypothetical protein n=1 Tax=Hymenobacter sp. TaxID=1898978 RepID=UPI002ED8081B
MKKLLIIAALAAGIGTATAQTPRSREGSTSAAQRASTTNSDSPPSSPITVRPNYSPGNGQRVGAKTNTTPATGPTRASRSSSGLKTPGQRKPTGSSNIESMSKTEKAGPKK